MYRFREIVYYNILNNNAKEKAHDYQNKLAYKFGVKVKVNDEVSGQFEIGNDWYATETVDAINKGNFAGSHRDIYPYFSLAYVKWNPGCMYMDVGIIPVAGSSLMDLIGNAMLADKRYGTAYAGAAHVSWGIITNFSVPGFRLGIPILKEDFKLGIDLTSTVLDEKTIKPAIEDAVIHNNSTIMFMADLPMSSGALTLKPSFIVNFNRFYKDRVFQTATTYKKNQADNEIGTGLEIGYKLSDAVCLRGGLGFAMMSNKNTWSGRDSVPDITTGAAAGAKIAEIKIDEKAINSNIGTTCKFGSGKLDIDLMLSTDVNKKVDSTQVIYPFVDLKYTWAVNKNFNIMPRTRMYFILPEVKYDMKLQVWPEIILFGTF